MLDVRDGRPALMFQDAALFPWLTVEENIAFPLRMQHAGRVERTRRVRELLQMVRLNGLENKRPHELSGGMRQRVALARALAQDTSILLMDEPFAALDPTTRDLLHDELEQLWSTAGLTVVFVTHQVGEAVRLGDRVLLLSGRPAQIGAEYRLDLPRPRRGGSLETAALVAEITERLRLEVHDYARI
jgi:NitT/TauT family transport system ATP-binding protein